MLKRITAAAVLAITALLAGCKDPGSAVSEPPPAAAPVEGVPDAGLAGKPRASGETLKAIRARGRLNCGVNPGLVGFSYTDNRGRWRGFDVDFCRATAAAVLGNPEAVRFVPLSSKERFTALQSGEVDVLWRNTSWTFSRDASNGLDFAGVNYFDGQGFLVRRSLELNSATELNGARICVQTGSTTELNLADWFRAKGLKYDAVVVDTEDQARANYAKEACDAFTADISALAAARSTMNSPGAHVILPEVISKEPLGPVVRQGDDQWADIVRWVLNASILAEEFGITAKNVDEVRKTSTNPEVRRLLGVEGGYGRTMGLSDEWAYRQIAGVGNYGEIFERNVGQASPLKLARGMNALWNANPPGLMYAPPMR
ncbi:amino acid ABC transporter substrate-binding protein [Caulobacter sp. 17J80-11]|uniref:amino acid ABC transporter substrate-binding protein n=1 Tax=Caulobacter sp. 17J80-11 TaxID=2763502 RepID=UPI001653BEC4|nr:amino acid ABC transporter substrate-binding protein [Caulobacter sp. 17J80-11]MBC6980860.1 amino acid ABC transporter substrate-binding protein [Caulobacter sp. 17J80-11]